MKPVIRPVLAAAALALAASATAVAPASATPQAFSAAQGKYCDLR
ncbi:hypothetical protein [Streptomyces chrestomyceticus]